MTNICYYGGILSKIIYRKIDLSIVTYLVAWIHVSSGTQPSQVRYQWLHMIIFVKVKEQLFADTSAKLTFAWLFANHQHCGDIETSVYIDLSIVAFLVALNHVSRGPQLDQVRYQCLRMTLFGIVIEPLFCRKELDTRFFLLCLANDQYLRWHRNAPLDIESCHISCGFNSRLVWHVNVVKCGTNGIVWHYVSTWQSQFFAEMSAMLTFFLVVCEWP